MTPKPGIPLNEPQIDRPDWVPFDAHPDYVYAAQQLYRWEPVKGDCRRHHGPHEGFRCNGAYGRLIEVRGEREARGIPLIDVELLRREFLRLLTQDSETTDRRRREYNQAIFNAEEGWPIWDGTDLDMVMAKFDKAVGLPVEEGKRPDG